MNRSNAKKIAEKITNVELKQMFDSAKNDIVDWTKVSIVNKGMSKGLAWNILAKDFDIDKTYSNLAKINMVREFGEYLENYKPVKNTRSRNNLPITHQDPLF